MTSFDTPGTRIGDKERETALHSLTSHLQAGRLTPQEYQERSLQVQQARFAQDIVPIFRDLPGDVPLTSGGYGTSPTRRRVQIVTITPLIATTVYVILGFTMDAWAWAWVVFLAIPMTAVLLVTDLFVAGDRVRERREHRRLVRGR